MKKGLCHSCHLHKEKTVYKETENQSLDKYLNTAKGAGAILCEQCGCRVKYTTKEDGTTQICYVSRD
jgi:hypothetical protein